MNTSRNKKRIRMPRKTKELAVRVPTARAFFGGGLDNPAEDDDLEAEVLPAAAPTTRRGPGGGGSGSGGGLRKAKELSVAVPSQRAFFGGGLDNPADEAESQDSTSGRRGHGAVRSNTAGKRDSRRSRPFPTASTNDAEPPPGPPTCGLSGAVDAMGLEQGPISARTRMRRRLGLPPPAEAAIATSAVRDRAKGVDDRLAGALAADVVRRHGEVEAVAALAEVGRAASQRRTLAPSAPQRGLAATMGPTMGNRLDDSESWSEVALARQARMRERERRTHVAAWQ